MIPMRESPEAYIVKTSLLVSKEWEKTLDNSNTPTITLLDLDIKRTMENDNFEEGKHPFEPRKDSPSDKCMVFSTSSNDREPTRQFEFHQAQTFTNSVEIESSSTKIPRGFYDSSKERNTNHASECNDMNSPFTLEFALANACHSSYLKENINQCAGKRELSTDFDQSVNLNSEPKQKEKTFKSIRKNANKKCSKSNTTNSHKEDQMLVTSVRTDHVVHLKMEDTGKIKTHMKTTPELLESDSSYLDEEDEDDLPVQPVIVAQLDNYCKKPQDSAYGTGSLQTSRANDSKLLASASCIDTDEGEDHILNQRSEHGTDFALLHYVKENNISIHNRENQPPYQKCYGRKFLQIDQSFLDILNFMQENGCIPSSINLINQDQVMVYHSEIPVERHLTVKREDTNVPGPRQETIIELAVNIVQTTGEENKRYEVQIDEECKETLRQLIDNRTLPTLRPVYTTRVEGQQSQETKKFLDHLKQNAISDHCGIIFSNENLIQEIGDLGCFKENRQYVVIKQLGSEGYGSVTLCETMHSHIQFVIKKIPRKKFREEEILIPIQQRETCDQMLDMYGIIVDEANVLVLMEYAAGGTLLHWRESFCILRDLPEFLLVLYKLLLGLKELHHAGISIFDIKESNIAFRKKGDPSSVVYLDWGSAKDLAKRYEDDSSFKNGTRIFYPPERHKVLTDRNLRAHDVWTLGCAALSFLNKRYTLEKYWQHAESEAKRMMSSPQSRCTIALRQKEIFSEMITRDCHLILEDVERVDQSCHEVCPELLDCLCQMVALDVMSRTSAEDILHHPVFHGLIYEETDIKRLSTEYKRNCLPTNSAISPFVNVRVLFSGKIIFTGILPRGIRVKQLIRRPAYNHQIYSLVPEKVFKNGYCLLLNRRNNFTIERDCILELSEAI